MSTSSEPLTQTQARWDELFSRIDQVFLTGSVSQWSQLVSFSEDGCTERQKPTAL